MPRVSVIMPCFNHARFVEESVASILKQTQEDLELIIVDDCSSDNSWELIQRLAQKDSRIKPIRHDRNRGASRSRNDGLRAAQGDFIGFCDSDDIWDRRKLEFQTQLLHENPDYGATYCDSIIVDETGMATGRRFSQRFPPPKPASGWLFQHLVPRNFINMQSVLMRKECLQDTGYFDEGIRWVEDWWYWIRLSRRHRFLYSPKPLARYRVHGCSTNLVQRRGYCVNRYKVYHRILQQCSDLPPHVKSEVVYYMGTELCEMGKRRAGHRLLWNSVKTSMIDWRTFSIFCRAMRRLLF